MRVLWAAGIGLIGMVAGCDSGGSAALTVDLRTDYLPGVEFMRVRSVVDSRSPTGVLEAREGQDFIAGLRVADLDLGDRSGSHDLDVALMDAAVVPLASRAIRVEVDGVTNVTVVIARRDAPPCASDADCVPAADCAEARCYYSTCLQTPIEGACRPGSVCSIDEGGCRSLPGSGCTGAMDCAMGEMCRSGTCVEPAAFRLTRLELLDPHVSAQASAGMCYCGDATSILNDYIGDDLTSLDRNIVFMFLPLAPAAVRNDFVGYGHAVCPDATTCSAGGETPPEGQATHTGAGTTSCFTPPPETLGGYGVPAAPLPPCFVSDPATLSFELGGAMLDFIEIRVAATFEGEPPSRLVQGVFAGFVTEDAARAATFPEAVASQICGDPTMYGVLGGGGACRGGDDRDDLDGDGTVDGWWMYFSFEADRVDWVVE